MEFSNHIMINWINRFVLKAAMDNAELCWHRVRPMPGENLCEQPFYACTQPESILRVLDGVENKLEITVRCPQCDNRFPATERALIAQVEEMYNPKLEEEDEEA